MTDSPRERREEIIAAALALFSDHGVRAVSTRQIAKAVGISQPSLYAHFTSSEDIAVEICVRGFHRLHERLTAALSEPGTPPVRLRRMGEEYVRFGLEHAAVYRLALMEDLPARTKGDPPPVLVAGIQAFGVLLSLFERTVADPAAANAMAQSVWASLHGLVALMLARPDFPWAERERLIDLHLTRACARAFARPPAASAQKKKPGSPARLSRRRS